MMRDERGIGMIGMFFWVAFLIAVVYQGAIVAGIYLDYGRMEDYMYVQANFAQMNKDEDILNNLLAKSKELDLPMKDRSNFVIVRTDSKIMISTEWYVEAHLFKIARFPSYPFHFRITVEQAVANR